VVNFGSIESESDGVDPRQLRILEGGEPVPCLDHDLWVRWMSEHNPPLCLSRVGVFVIETVFTGIWEAGCLWETRITPKLSEDSAEVCAHSSAENAVKFHSDQIAVAVEQMRIRESSEAELLTELEEEKK